MEKKRSILIFKFSLVIGGGERHNLILSNELKKRGWSVLVFSNFKPLLSRFKKEGIKSKKFYWGPEASARRNVIRFLISFPMNYIRFLFLLLINFRRESENVVLFQNLNEKLIATKMAKKIGYKVFWIEHLSIDPWLTKNILKGSYVHNSQYANKIITVSETIKKELIEKIGINENKVATVNNGIDLDAFRPEEKDTIEAKKKELGFYKGSKIIGFVGRLHTEKGVDTLLNAFSLVLKRFDSAYLLIIGDGPDRKKFEELSHRLGLEIGRAHV